MNLKEMKKFRYTQEQKDKISAIVKAGEKAKKSWQDIADDVNSAKIVPRSFDSRTMFKTQWAWKTAAKKSSPKATKPSKPAKVVVLNQKRKYTKRATKQQLRVLNPLIPKKLTEPTGLSRSLHA